MSNKLQSLDSIQKVSVGQNSGSQDAVKNEYQEGLRFLQQLEYGQAAVALHNALIGFEQKEDEAGIANASNQLGHVCLLRNEYEGALKHYHRALTICEKNNDRMSTLAVLLKIVAAHKGLKEYAQAIVVCLDMLDLYQDNRDPQGAVATLETMAEIYLENAQREKAADAYRTIASIHKNFRHDTMAAQYMEKAEELEKTAV